MSNPVVRKPMATWKRYVLIPLIALSLSFVAVPQKRANAIAPVVVALLVIGGVGLLVAAMVGMGKAFSQLANVPCHPDQGPIAVKYKFACTDPADKTAVLVFESPDHPGFAVRYVLSKGSVVGPEAMAYTHVAGTAGTTSYKTESGVSLVADRNNPTSGDITGIDGKSLHMNCTTKEPSKADTLRWTNDADALAAAVGDDAGKRVSAAGTAYESGSWDRAPAAQKRLAN